MKCLSDLELLQPKRFDITVFWQTRSHH